MDLTKYSLEDVLTAAVKSEVLSRDVYAVLAKRVRNAFLKERLTFLSGEEEKHRLFIEKVWEETFPGKEITLPEKTPVPIPTLTIPDERVPLSDVFSAAMEAEEASHAFYTAAAGLFEEGEPQRMLYYFAAMEMNHYRILEVEHETMKRFEDYDTEWPMMNVGP